MPRLDRTPQAQRRTCQLCWQDLLRSCGNLKWVQSNFLSATPKYSYKNYHSTRRHPVAKTFQRPRPGVQPTPHREVRTRSITKLCHPPVVCLSDFTTNEEADCRNGSNPWTTAQTPNYRLRNQCEYYMSRHNWLIILEHSIQTRSRLSNSTNYTDFLL